MAILKILTIGSPALKKKAKAIKKVEQRHRKLLADMEETMRAAPGIGLAAPQVGISERLIVADIGEGLFCLINPKVVKKSGMVVCREGCLSVPGVDAPVERYANVSVKAIDKTGKQVLVNAEGLFSVVLQHEIDHLDGILFVERVKDPSLITVKKIEKEETI